MMNKVRIGAKGNTRGQGLRRAIEEYLGLLCGTCGASAAQLRLYEGERCEGKALDEICGSLNIDQGMEFSLRESNIAPGGFGAWRLEGNGYGNKLLFSRKLGGMTLALDLQLNETSPSFISRRLSATKELLGVLEHLVPLTEIYGADQEASVNVGTGTGGAFDPPIIGLSRQINRLREDIRKVAAGTIHVLVRGESGTGKELVARNIHTLGPRKGGPFIAVNCMEMPAGLLQGELFGSAKGAFTGAVRDREGLIETAGGGTFLLDEIGELPDHLQAALLRVLQENEVRRLGEGRIRKIDVRFVFATNRNLESLVREGRFREDLYFRINGIRLDLPPLRERRDDILLLATHFMRELTEQMPSGMKSITAGAVSRLLRYKWPGNVRELRNEIEKAVTMNPDAVRITRSMFQIPDESSIRLPVPDSGIEPTTLPEAVARLERRMIVRELENHMGNRTRTAKALGITRQGLLKKLKRMNIQPGRSGGQAE
jgi:transcriptional regulator with PAS, ATPase and Fis domain